MARKVYRINVIGHPPIYKVRKEDVLSWSARNPGELQSYDAVDPIDELNRLASELDDYHKCDSSCMDVEDE